MLDMYVQRELYIQRELSVERETRHSAIRYPTVKLPQAIIKIAYILNTEAVRY